MLVYYNKPDKCLLSVLGQLSCQCNWYTCVMVRWPQNICKCTKAFHSALECWTFNILYPQDEDEFSLWQQERNQNVHRDQLLHGHHQYLSLLNEDDEDEFMVDGWRHANPFHNSVANIQGVVQVWHQCATDNVLYLQQCLSSTYFMFHCFLFVLFTINNRKK